MAFFIPLMAAMAGNVGVQSSSIIVQSLASGNRNFDSVGRKLFKELSVAFSTALLFSILIFLYNFFFTGNMGLTYSVSITLFIVMIFASLYPSYAMTKLRNRCDQLARRANHLKTCPSPRAKIFRFLYPPNQRLFTRRPDPARGADRASSRTRDGMRWTLAARRM